MMSCDDDFRRNDNRCINRVPRNQLSARAGSRSCKGASPCPLTLQRNAGWTPRPPSAPTSRPFTPCPCTPTSTPKSRSKSANSSCTQIYQSRIFVDECMCIAKPSCNEIEKPKCTLPESPPSCTCSQSDVEVQRNIPLCDKKKQKTRCRPESQPPPPPNTPETCCCCYCCEPPNFRCPPNKVNMKRSSLFSFSWILKSRISYFFTAWFYALACLTTMWFLSKSLKTVKETYCPDPCLAKQPCPENYCADEEDTCECRNPPRMVCVHQFDNDPKEPLRKTLSEEEAGTEQGWTLFGVLTLQVLAIIPLFVIGVLVLYFLVIGLYNDIHRLVDRIFCGHHHTTMPLIDPLYPLNLDFF